MEILDKKIKNLAGKNLSQTGEWEIAQVPEAVSNSQSGDKTKVLLNLVVHRESYFIFNTYICYPEENNSAAKTLLEAIEKHKAIPNILLVREKKIMKELEPIARAFSFTINYPARLKVVPNVLREIKGTLRRFPRKK